MDYRKRKATIDDGMNPELVYGAEFDGYFGIPLIRKPDKFIIPSDIVPFTKKIDLKETILLLAFMKWTMNSLMF